MFEFRSPTFLVRHPKLIKQMAVKDFDHFFDHRPLITEDMDKMMGNVLMILSGQKWKGNVTLSSKLKLKISLNRYAINS